ncbi:MAG: hypothetical protein HYZ53_23150 [Planctomycetes bacterium]|nr:hypothetical protein [Planctomycetota bacterium]
MPDSIGGALALFGGASIPELAFWPPDLFAFTSTVLAASDACRRVVWPPVGQSWPQPLDWAERVTSAARTAVTGERFGAPDFTASVRRPTEVMAWCRMVGQARGVRLAELDRPQYWALLSAILGLHAWADETCAGAGYSGFGQGDDEFRFLLFEAWMRLREGLPLNRRGVESVRIYPKARVPQAGVTLRSLSHHLSAYWGSVQVRWQPTSRWQARGSEAELNVLLLPWPLSVSAQDFHEVPARNHRLRNLPPEMGFFTYDPSSRRSSRLPRLGETIRLAQRQVGRIDAVVLPECALSEATEQRFAAEARNVGVQIFVAGVRRRNRADLAENFASIRFFGTDRAGEEGWYVQHKHHRWLLDGGQIRTYALDPPLIRTRRWWEAIQLRARSVGFFRLRDWMVMCPLVCEDLARVEPVAELLRAIGPTFVLALLFDGPQLSGRWPAQYATVLADDPGSSVLTLSCLGMVSRSRPPGTTPSRIVGLWKDPINGLREIALDERAVGVVLRLVAQPRDQWTADGRMSSRTLPFTVLDTPPEQIFA